jgi:hypothetical protein
MDETLDETLIGACVQAAARVMVANRPTSNDPKAIAKLAATIHAEVRQLIKGGEFKDK